MVKKNHVTTHKILNITINSCSICHRLSHRWKIDIERWNKNKIIATHWIKCWYDYMQTTVRYVCNGAPDRVNGHKARLDRSPLFFFLVGGRGTQFQYKSLGPLTRYPKFRVTRVPRMPGTFSPPLRDSNPDMHHGTCVTHVPWCMPGSLTSGFLWNQWRGKRSQHCRRMHNPQFGVSGKRPMDLERWIVKTEGL